MAEEEEIVVDAYPPWNFSWFVPGQVAAMAFPRTKENLQFLVDEGIKHLITLSPEKKPPMTECPSLQWTEIAVKEFEVPSMKKIRDFIEICQRSQLKGEAIGVHCRQGRGRTGVMLACYLMVFQGLSPERAMAELRQLRPGSCETEEQEQAVVQYNDCLRGGTKIDYREVDDKKKFDERFGEDENKTPVVVENQIAAAT